MEIGHQGHLSVRKEPEIRSWFSDWPLIQIQGTVHSILLDTPLEDKKRSQTIEILSQQMSHMTGSLQCHQAKH